MEKEKKKSTDISTTEKKNKTQLNQKNQIMYKE